MLCHPFVNFHYDVSTHLTQSETCFSQTVSVNDRHIAQFLLNSYANLQYKFRTSMFSSSLIYSSIPFCDRLRLFLPKPSCIFVMPSQIQHQKVTKHCLCPCCNSYENFEELLEGRLPSIDKHICPQCKQSFALLPALEAHQRQYLHAYCFNCNIISPTKWHDTLHMRLHVGFSANWTPAATQVRCCGCKRDFVNVLALMDHLRNSKAHEGNRIEDLEPANGNNCTKCKRKFKSQRALEQHLDSARHNPLSNI